MNDLVQTFDGFIFMVAQKKSARKVIIGQILMTLYTT
jgi:hypothetical protein